MVPRKQKPKKNKNKDKGHVVPKVRGKRKKKDTMCQKKKLKNTQKNGHNVPRNNF